MIIVHVVLCYVSSLKPNCFDKSQSVAVWPFPNQMQEYSHDVSLTPRNVSMSIAIK